MDETKIDEMRNLQNFLGGYSDFTLEQLKLLPYLIFLEIKNCKIEITEPLITVSLIPYTGIKGWWLRRKYRKTDVQRAKLLTQYILFWAPKGAVKPKVIIQWTTS
jgi:hypothetical protein